MAIVNNGTVNSLGESNLPADYTRPTVAAFSDYEYKRILTLNVLKSTVETATGAGTMAAILANATIGINKQIADILAADYLATAAVTAYAELKHLTHNLATIKGDGDYLKNTPLSYVCTVYLYVKAV